MSYDDLSCFTPMSTIIIQTMFCQRSTLRVDACGHFVLYPCSICCSDEAPQRCQWMPLCSVALSHVTIAYAKIQKSQSTYNKYHLLALPCHSSVHMAHSKSSNNLSPSCSFTHSASDHPSTPPPVVPTGHFWAPWPSPPAASTAAPAARSCSRKVAWPD